MNNLADRIHRHKEKINYMDKIRSLIRPDLLTLKPYSSARNEFTGSARIYLDANENPYGTSFRGVTGLNRYPDPLQRELKVRLSQISGMAEDSIIVGNGSDEILDLLVRATTVPGRSNVITMPPTYGMYSVVAAVNNVAVTEVLPAEDFSFSAESVLGTADSNTAIIFICSPNNPTGNMAPRDEVQKLAEQFEGLLVIDEAYIDFSGTDGFMDMLSDYDNIFILRTFSKARGMAGARLGTGYGHPLLVSVLNAIKMPYNVNSLSLEAAMQSLNKQQVYSSQVERITEGRESLSRELQKIPGVQKVYPSAANFILARFERARELYNYLLGKGIVVRDRSDVPLCEGCLRISVGTERENEVLLEEIGNFYKGAVGAAGGTGTENGASTTTGATGTENGASPTDSGAGTVKERRRTGETDVLADINLYGRGIADIQTGVGFLDHMLELFTFHSGSDMMIRASGDVHVDMHHTVEDIAITLGLAVKKALGDGKGINRYGFVLPMDGSRAIISIDMGGRNMLVWDVGMKETSIGGIPADMFRHFFRSFSDNAGCTLHIEAKGEDDHHIIEAVFKGFARALKEAVRVTGDRVQSTKSLS